MWIPAWPRPTARPVESDAHSRDLHRPEWPAGSTQCARARGIHSRHGKPEAVVGGGPSWGLSASKWLSSSGASCCMTALGTRSVRPTVPSAR